MHFGSLKLLSQIIYILEETVQLSKYYCHRNPFPYNYKQSHSYHNNCVFMLLLDVSGPSTINDAPLTMATFGLKYF